MKFLVDYQTQTNFLREVGIGHFASPPKVFFIWTTLGNTKLLTVVLPSSMSNGGVLRVDRNINE